MQIQVLTLFPDYFKSCLESSILARAQAKGLVEIKIINLRDFTHDERQTADDRPFGGGPGMVLKIEPIAEALAALEKQGNKGKVLLTSASGRLLTQQVAQSLAQESTITLICGHYQGVDQRVIDHLIDGEIRIGDYVLTGGEPAVSVIIDAVTRLIPGVLGNEGSVVGESHEVAGQGNYPDYTRPENYNGWQVPEILLQGNHKAIAEWREANRKNIE